MQVYPGLTLSAVGTTAPVVPFQTPSIQVGQLAAQSITVLGIVCTISTGASLTYSVQVTGDPPNDFVNWNNHDVLQNLTTSAYGQVLYPVSGIRLAVTSWTSGSVNLGIVQWR